MKSSLESLLEHKLLFVTGKGGVGKTTVSVALGLLAAQQGKKTILVEVNSTGAVSTLVGRRKIGYKPEKLNPQYPLLQGINIDPHSSFKEYVLMQIKFKTLYKAVFENKLVRYFIDATPGLADLMCIGKIYSLVEEYDLVIVDAPATGHGLALLTIPQIVSSAVKVGPLGHEAQKIDALLHDEKTRVVLVTIPEDMPVTETIELAEKLKSEKFHVGPLFLNRTNESLLGDQEEKIIQKSDIDEGLKLLAELEKSREELAEFYQKELSKSFSGELAIHPLPFVYSEDFGLKEVEDIARKIEESF